MKRLNIFLLSILTCFTFILFTSSTQAQLVLNKTLTPTQLVNNVLIGTGVTVSNISYTGSNLSYAEFDNGGTTNLGLMRGIALCSGDVSLVVGPNNQVSAGMNVNTNGDPQLNALIPGYTSYDAAVLEFDFVPLSDTIRFRYVFGSDEYPEYSNSNYNDVFGFFVSGPNPLGGNYTNYNMAMLPNTTTPVSINNVNNGTSASGPCMNCTYYINNNGGLTLQYDGLTVVLTAWAKVVPCQTYHFKIAIGDAGDHILDSGVFLEENSFSTDAIQVESDYSVPGAGKIAIEGCNNAIIRFMIPKIKQDTFWIHFDTMYGTATNGVDFPFIADSIAVPPGLKKVNLVVAPIVDGVIEGIEFLYIIIKTSQCTTDTLIIPIADYTPITTTTSNDTMVCYDTAFIWVNPHNGGPPYNYTWSPPIGLSALNIANPTAAPPQTTLYYVSITDTTGCPAVKDSVLVTVNPSPSVSFMPDKLTGCEPLTVTFTDMSSPAIATWNWDFGDGTTSTLQNPSHTYNSGLFSVTLSVMTVEGCPGYLYFPNLIDSKLKPKAYFEALPPVTSIDYATIQFNDMSTSATQWSWNFGDGGTDNIQSPAHTYSNEGVYQVCLKVTSMHGCVDSICREAMVIIDKVEIPNIITPNGDGFNDKFVIKNIDKIPESTLVIFNRWGKKIYEANNYQNTWDGDDHADGVYYYVLWVKTYFKEQEFNGTVTIMR